MTILLHMDGSPVPDFPVDSFNDIWDEIVAYKPKDMEKAEKSYILLEDRTEGENYLATLGVDGWYDFRRLLISPVSDGSWGVVLNDGDEQVVGIEDLESKVRAFMEGA